MFKLIRKLIPHSLSPGHDIRGAFIHGPKLGGLSQADTVLRAVDKLKSREGSIYTATRLTPLGI